MLWKCRCCGPDACCHGGYGGVSSFSELRDNDGYFTGSDTWQSFTDLPSPGRQAHGGAVLNGLGYAIAGQSHTGERADNDEYDPTADAWTARTDLTAPTRLFISAVGASNSVYAFGGFHQAGGPNGYLDYVQNDGYSPASDSWSSKADMPAPSRRAGSSAAVTEKVYSWGGLDGDTTQLGGAPIRDNDEYDPSGDSWASKTDLPTPVRWGIRGGASVAGKGYVIGGATGYSSFPETGLLDDCDEYNPAGDAWTSKTGGGLSHYFHAVAQTRDGRVHAFGGTHFGTFYSSTHQSYDPSVDSWISVPGVPAPGRTDAAAFGM